MKASSEELMVFVTVVESGSFSRAAEQLGQDNSVVSRTIKRLEQKLDIQLLNRTTRQISLTHEGERYFTRVQKILQDMAAAENDLLEHRNEPQGLLRIDAATPVILHVLSPLVAEFTRRYPKMTLSLYSSESNINLIDQKVDVAVRVGELEDSSLRARKLMLSYRHVLASPAYLQQWGVPKSVDDLANHRCLGFNEVLALNKWPLLCADGQQLTITPFVSAGSGETLRQLCLSGNGIACLSDFMINKDIERGDLVALLVPDVMRIAMPLHAVYYSDQAVSTRIRCFIDFLSEKLGQDDPEA
ncbi:LysR family transcriptional regulator [Rouxiella silvae]|uniref:LysR family transcriptional regulator n=1 Tax=Rouxiella silvae TaxID=1646373 RepID=A0AA41BWK6_9GAMM|nr:DNA-binding transcriptional regulator YafC [Rouxiella silvae]KQN44106.1 LysR family transcriptional regulator [Serratia sp. Leaf50]MBF6636989.1 LysR family transcriptional regulator [Rouxiella silvae]ORJ22315.1 LysR family transcriptional regulator [Rouxiella silvae]